MTSAKKMRTTATGVSYFDPAGLIEVSGLVATPCTLASSPDAPLRNAGANQASTTRFYPAFTVPHGRCFNDTL
jgi:hypothetical protein